MFFFFLLQCTRTAGQYEVILHDPPSTLEPYLALSYCWGGDQPHKTTRERIISEEFNLAWSNLPASIQDAVKVTIQLGYQFLWVDSLCIVQDDELDKAQQIALMPQIYSNAAVTIIASSAAKAIEGFLYERPARATKLAVKLPFHCPDEHAPLSGVRRGFIYAVKFAEEARAEPIDHRGWTLQERYLSPRVLEFGSDHVTWSCHTQHGYNQPSDGWKAFNNQASMRPEKRFREKLLQGPSLRNSFDDAIIFDDGFYSLVEVYSRRSLSVHSDRILAMSGIAAQYSSVRSDRKYAAGLWVDNIHGGLLWRVVPGCRRSRRVQARPGEPGYQAPSWSWAAVNDVVDFYFFRLTWYSVVPRDMALEAHTTLVSEEAPCGAVRHGRITGRGVFCRAFWFGRQAETRHTLHRLTPESPAPQNVEIIPMLQMCPDAAEREFSTMREIMGRPEHGEVIEVHLLLFGMIENPTSPAQNESNGPVGLVLREVDRLAVEHVTHLATGSSVKRYSRLGVFSIHRGKNSRGMKGEEADEFLESLFQDEQEQFEII